MISVQDAIRLIKENTTLLSPVSVPLPEALGFVLADAVSAGVSLPGFNQAGMDGYAFRYADYQNSNVFVINGEVAAGDAARMHLLPQQAVRIFTGAPVPPELDTVVMQEKTTVNGDSLVVLDDNLEQGSNVRKEGAEIRKGDTALAKGTLLTPAAIGFLTGAGVTEVSVYPKPVVHIIATGKELVKPGIVLQHGQVYESNSVMLQAALRQLHINDITVTITGDHVTEIFDALQRALAEADLILLSGGVSVGDYDRVTEAAKTCGVQPLFHKVAQRPGKPLYAATKGGKMVFGLPGNPASVLTCYYVYVTTAIEAFTGSKELVQKEQLPLAAAFDKKISLTQFLKASRTDEGVLPLSAQESFRLSSFALADCLIVLPPEPKTYKKGERVEVLRLPYL